MPLGRWRLALGRRRRDEAVPRGPATEIAAAVSELPNAWLHVDGAFGLWAAASPDLRDRVPGLELADSWASDMRRRVAGWRMLIMTTQPTSEAYAYIPEALLGMGP